MLTRAIPISGEHIPVVGLGTWQAFDVEDITPSDPLLDVVKSFVATGGSVVDSSPMYGNAEKIMGDLSASTGLNDRLFMATKIWTHGKDNGVKQLRESMKNMQRSTMDLMQIHNITDWQTHLKMLRAEKEKGTVRYIGITHYTESAYNALEKIMLTEPIDFLQINYSLLSRTAEERLFPLAEEKKIAIMINRPFEEGRLFSIAKERSFPSWANDFDCTTWSQFFLKFILSHPAVTCVIPATAKPRHMVDNMQAGEGKLPTKEQRLEMIRYVES